jgi:hypothetical protein
MSFKSFDELPDQYKRLLTELRAAIQRWETADEKIRPIIYEQEVRPLRDELNATPEGRIIADTVWEQAHTGGFVSYATRDDDMEQRVAEDLLMDAEIKRRGRMLYALTLRLNEEEDVDTALARPGYLRCPKAVIDPDDAAKFFGPGEILTVLVDTRQMTVGHVVRALKRMAHTVNTEGMAVSVRESPLQPGMSWIAKEALLGPHDALMPKIMHAHLPAEMIAEDFGGFPSGSDEPRPIGIAQKEAPLDAIRRLWGKAKPEERQRILQWINDQT